MSSGRSVLEFVVQFLNVMRHGQEDDGDEGVFSASSEKSAKVHVGLGVCECALGLDAPVGPQLDAFFRCDPREVFLPLAQEFLRDGEMLRAFFHRLLEVVAVDAVLLQRAILAVFAGVAGLLALVAGLRLRLVRPLRFQLAVVRAEIGVFFREVRHVLEAPDIVLPFARLAFFVVAGLDERVQAVVFEIRVVLLTLIAGIRNNVLAACPVVLLELAQKSES